MRTLQRPNWEFFVFYHPKLSTSFVFLVRPSLQSPFALYSPTAATPAMEPMVMPAMAPPESPGSSTMIVVFVTGGEGSVTGLAGSVTGLAGSVTGVAWSVTGVVWSVTGVAGSGTVAAVSGTLVPGASVCVAGAGLVGAFEGASGADVSSSGRADVESSPRQKATETERAKRQRRVDKDSLKSSIKRYWRYVHGWRYLINVVQDMFYNEDMS